MENIPEWGYTPEPWERGSSPDGEKHLHGHTLLESTDFISLVHCCMSIASNSA